MCNKIRVLAEARGAYRKAFLEQMVFQSDGKIEVGLHFGDKDSDFDVPSLMRQEIKYARSGRITQKTQYAGANLQLITSQDFHFSAERFADQLHRSSSKYQKRSHKMLNLHEYIDYYHILSDAIGQKIIEREITHAIFFDIPHLAIDTLIYDVCVSMDIQVIILTQVFPDQLFSMSRIEDFGKCHLDIKNAPEYPLNNSGQLDLWYMEKGWQKKGPRGQFRFIHAIRLLTYLGLKSPKSLLNLKYVARLVTRISRIVEVLPEWRDPLHKFFDHDYLDYLEYLVGFENNSVDFSIPYIYVPLHLQPEMTTSALGGIYRDQLLMLEHLHQLLPIGWKILVKENPKQGPFARGSMFFHRFNRLENALMVPSDTNTNKLTKNSKIVATVTGTAAWEAIQMGIPAITFGNAWFNNLPGVSQFDPNIDILKVSHEPIDTQRLSLCAGALFQKCHSGNIDKGYFHISASYEKKQNEKAIGKLLSDLLIGKVQLSFSSEQKTM